jgi:hypothetical protein
MRNAKHSVICRDCGHPHATARTNTRYCHTCRLFRNLVYLTSRKSKCLSCRDTFAPLHSNDKLCAKCDVLAEGNPDGRCGVCLLTDVRLVKGGADIALCLACAKDPEKRKVVMEAVAQKRYKRITADPVALPAEDVAA